MGFDKYVGLESDFKKKLKIFTKIIFVLLISICIGAMLLFTAYLIPVEYMEQNLKESIPVFEHEGTYPTLIGWSTSVLDNFTDALMLLTAVYEDDTPILNQMLTACSEMSRDKNPVENLIEYYSQGRMTGSVPYSRYWHGYLIFLKPLFTIMNYGEIRILNCYLLMAVVGTLIYKIYRVKKNIYVLPTLLLIGVLPIVSTAWSLHNLQIYYIFVIGSIILIVNYRKWYDTDKMILFFVILGILTSYFDLMTYPLVTFGVPICYYFCMNPNNNLLKDIKHLTEYGISWIIGYGGMWFGKWAVASMLTKQNVILDALGAMQERTSMTSGWGEKVNIIEMISYNAKAFLHNPVIAFVILFCIVTIVRIIKHHWLNHMKSHLIFLIIASLPIIWYIATPNHSMTHWWLFTYKELGITAFAVMCFLARLVEDNESISDGREAGND